MQIFLNVNETFIIYILFRVCELTSFMNYSQRRIYEKNCKYKLFLKIKKGLCSEDKQLRRF